MVTGLDIFRSHFADFTGHYVLIGGSAATLAMAEAGIEFRATRDLDIVLTIDVLDADFAAAFWEFVKLGGYQLQQHDGSPPRLYRFLKPEDPRFPSMIELFSRRPDGLPVPAGAHLTRMTAAEGVSGLSVIMLDDAYYDFVVAGRITAAQLAWVGADRPIPLKALAWLNLTARKAAGEFVPSQEIQKHANDVLRLSQLLAPGMAVPLPERIAQDLARFLGRLAQEHTARPAQLGLNNVTIEQVVARVRQAYGLGTGQDSEVQEHRG